jgi:hypothetical protein
VRPAAPGNINAIYRDGIRYDTYLAIAVAALIRAYLG